MARRKPCKIIATYKRPSDDRYVAIIPVPAGTHHEKVYNYLLKNSPYYKPRSDVAKAADISEEIADNVLRSFMLINLVERSHIDGKQKYRGYPIDAPFEGEYEPIRRRMTKTERARIEKEEAMTIEQKNDKVINSLFIKSEPPISPAPISPTSPTPEEKPFYIEDTDDQEELFDQTIALAKLINSAMDALKNELGRCRRQIRELKAQVAEYER